MFGECAGLLAKLEEGDFAFRALAHAKWDDRSTHACTDVHGAFRIGGISRTIEAVHVLVPRELSYRELVEPSHGDLPSVRMSGEYERHSGVPKAIGFFPDV